MQKRVKELFALLQESKNIIITTHKNPDGDAIGSSLALFHFLKKVNIKTSVITPNRHPSFLDWVPGINEIIIFDEEKDKSIEMISKSDLILTLDFNSLSRCGEISEHINKNSTNFVMIDHHQNPDNYAKILFSEPDRSSTSELVYEIINKTKFYSTIEKNIASCIYLGMMTDTGCFQYNGVTSRTFEIISDLLSKGIEHNKIFNYVFNNSSKSKLSILSKALLNLNIIENNQTSYMYLSKKDLIDSNHKKGDIEGVVNYGLKIKNINFTALFTEDLEDDDLIKISFRSKKYFPCNIFAELHFEGGGHINAAGGKFNGSINEAINLFKEKLKQFKISNYED